MRAATSPTGPAPRAAISRSPRLTAPSTFAAQIAALSEPDGYFDTDNLISNESSYLHVVGKIRELGIRGGAYIASIASPSMRQSVELPSSCKPGGRLVPPMTRNS